MKKPRAVSAGDSSRGASPGGVPPLSQNPGESRRAQDVADALQLMVRLRATTPYRSRGFLLLNAACCRLGDRFWADADPDGSWRRDHPGADGRKVKVRK